MINIGFKFFGNSLFDSKPKIGIDFKFSYDQSIIYEKSTKMKDEVKNKNESAVIQKQEQKQWDQLEFIKFWLKIWKLKFLYQFLKVKLLKFN